MENQESGELEMALDLISIQFLNLMGLSVRIQKNCRDTYLVHRNRIIFLHTKGEYAATTTRVPLVRFVVIRRNMSKHGFECLWSPFNGDQTAATR